MWDHLPIRTLLDARHATALADLDRQIADDYRHGYIVDADRGLEQRHRMTEG